MHLSRRRIEDHTELNVMVTAEEGYPFKRIRNYWRRIRDKRQARRMVRLMAREMRAKGPDAFYLAS